MEENTSRIEIKRQLRLEFRVPHDMPTLRATNVVIGIQGSNEVLVHFFEERTPLLIGDQEEVTAAAAKIDSIPANCVVRMVITLEKLHEFAGVFAQLAKQFPLEDK